MARLECTTAYTRAFVQAALPKGARRILEIGCGGGALAIALSSDGFEIVAIDADPEAVKASRRRGVNAVLAEWPNWNGGGFDAVLFTRSLHHIHDLTASVARACDALAPAGRLIVEDFLAEGASAGNEAWFASLAALLDAAGLLKAPTPFLLQLLGKSEPEDHHHQLHSSSAIEAALRSRFEDVRVEPAAYYFRYLVPAAGGILGEALLAHETALIDAGVIDPLGKRFIASR